MMRKIMFVLLIISIGNISNGQISWGFQLGMSVRETSWNIHKPSGVFPLYYTSIDLLPMVKVGIMSEYKLNNFFSVEISPAYTVHRPFTRGSGTAGQENWNIFTTRLLELPVVAKITLPVNKTITWSTGAGAGVDLSVDAWQHLSTGSILSTENFKFIVENNSVQTKSNVIPFVVVQTGFDFHIKKSAFYVGAEGHFQTVKNYTQHTEVVEWDSFIPQTVTTASGTSFNTNYLLIKIGYWIRKR